MTRSAVFRVSAVLAGCGGMDPQLEHEENIANLIEAGHPANDIRVIDESVFEGGRRAGDAPGVARDASAAPGGAEHRRLGRVRHELLSAHGPRRRVHHSVRSHAVRGWRPGR
ncbi:hypothetical protein MYSTI_01583 [Myxococcus stipitatus DSM 14675]|uniref:Uncharacterized protein n=1 Tax=Myxococcus stipitatus (strain DSM 14675 / JCM 12634 / Mx s8) TaxID=1278073 RepID=L7U2C1_MYXSD|nr:hypothetical protein MYSTI_01583 [Myxococcus stipitatus DSM 14675]